MVVVIYYTAEIGVGLTLAGGLFMTLGLVLFFDRALLALGNVCGVVHANDTVYRNRIMY